MVGQGGVVIVLVHIRYKYVPQQPRSQVCPTRTAADTPDVSKTPKTGYLEMV